jgi:iron-sulfur cluster assembly accessory protein
MEIKITEKAKEKIISSAKEYKVDPIVRVYVTGGGCSGGKFGIAFDEAKQYDIMTEIDGIEILTDSEYVPKFSDGLNIDYVITPKEGYIISTLRPIKKDCGSGSGSGCSGCKKD